jgi:predicted amidohydrolase YtcJ
VNRKTASGHILGESERISVQDALYAVALDAAYLLKIDHESGSIEIDKRANFCVLKEDPLAIPPEMFKDVAVWGTVHGVRSFKHQSPNE